MRSFYKLSYVIIHRLIHGGTIEQTTRVECFAVFSELSLLVYSGGQEERLDRLHSDSSSSSNEAKEQDYGRQNQQDNSKRAKRCVGRSGSATDENEKRCKNRDQEHHQTKSGLCLLFEVNAPRRSLIKYPLAVFYMGVSDVNCRFRQRLDFFRPRI